MKIFLIALALCGVAAAEEKKPAPVMPSEIVLTSGRVLKRAEVVRWEKTRVVLKYAGGTEPIHFSLIKNVSQADLETIRDSQMVEQKARDDAKKEAIRKDEQAREQAARIQADEEAKCEDAANNKRLREGQSLAQVRRVLGPEIRTNVYASGREIQRMFEATHVTYYCYFNGSDVLTSWQIAERRY